MEMKMTKTVERANYFGTYLPWSVANLQEDVRGSYRTDGVINREMVMDKWICGGKKNKSN